MVSLKQVSRVALAVALVLGSAASLMAQPIPPGSYQSSCRNIELYGTGITATCQRLDGSFLQTSLFSHADCTGDIFNFDGLLLCNPGEEPPLLDSPSAVVASDDQLAAALAGGSGGVLASGSGLFPGGSYIKTCGDIRVQDNKVFARCLRNNGTYRDASTTYRPNSFISNCDGYLVDSRVCETPAPGSGGVWNSTRPDATALEVMPDVPDGSYGGQIAQ